MQSSLDFFERVNDEGINANSKLYNWYMAKIEEYTAWSTS